MRFGTVAANLAPLTWLMFGASGHSQPRRLRVLRLITPSPFLR